MSPAFRGSDLRLHSRRHRPERYAPLQSGVGGPELAKNPTAKQAEQNQLRLYRKYHDLIEKCEKLDSDKIKLLEQIADNFS